MCFWEKHFSQMFLEGMHVSNILCIILLNLKYIHVYVHVSSKIMGRSASNQTFDYYDSAFLSFYILPYNFYLITSTKLFLLSNYLNR